MRSGLRRFLRRRGASQVDIDNAARGDYLALLVLDREVLPGERRYTLAELAERGKTDVATARAIWRAIGFPDIPDDLPAFTDADVEGAARLPRDVPGPVGARLVPRRRPRAGPGRQLVDGPRRRRRHRRRGPVVPCRTRGRHVRRGARGADRATGRLRRDRRADRPPVPLAAALRVLAPARRARLRADPVSSRAGSGSSTWSATPRSPKSSRTRSSSRCCNASATLAHDTVVASGGRIVKTIGDEVMFVTDTAATAAGIAVHAHASAPRVTICCR